MAALGKPLVIPIFIPHMGCPHQCIFCNQKAISFPEKKVPEPGQIHRIIDAYLRYKGHRSRVEVAFYGGNFLGLAPETVTALLEIVQPYADNGIIDGIRFSTRPDTIRGKTLDLISPYRISAVELGVQSMADTVLAASGRGHTAKDTCNAIDLLKKNKYCIGVQLMVGLPGDNEKKLMAGTRTIAGLSPDFARIYPLLVLAQSPLERLFKQGGYVPLNLDEGISLTKKMVSVLKKKQIRVIRVGLQASDIMSDESVVLAGPWHPAFGHLVFSGLMFDDLAEQIRSYPGGIRSNRVSVIIHPKSESRLRGDKNSNLEKLAREFPHIEVIIKKDDRLAIDQVKLETENV